MELNFLQRKAVETDGFTIVVAGPGTGKTRTLTSKIQYLITSKKVNPNEILALTFTRRAAYEIAERLNLDYKNKPFVGTFHSLAYKNMPDFKIESEEDYDKLLLDFYKHLKEKKLNLEYEYVLIDEFQDTNEIQYEILKLIANKNIMVIGDPYQSIYSFRGANFMIFERFKKDFNSYKEITLLKNYRSFRNITNVSKKLFPEIKLLNVLEEAGEVRLIECLNERAEADFICNYIISETGGVDLNNTSDGESKFSDFAIIYRNHFLRGTISERLKREGVPYQVASEGSIWESAEGVNLIEKIKKLKNKNRKLSKFIKKYSDNEEIFSLTKRFDEYENGVEKFLEYIEDQEAWEYYDPNLNCVTLLTMHASKGLEFENVFIVGFEDSFKKKSDINEEKRLLYVSMTRAKRKLYLMYCQKRNGKETKVSRFLKALKGKDLVEIIDPNMEKIIRRIEKNKFKKAQISLF